MQHKTIERSLKNGPEINKIGIKRTRTSIKFSIKKNLFIKFQIIKKNYNEYSSHAKCIALFNFLFLINLFRLFEIGILSKLIW